MRVKLMITITRELSGSNVITAKELAMLRYKRQRERNPLTAEEVRKQREREAAALNFAAAICGSD